MRAINCSYFEKNEDFNLIHVYLHRSNEMTTGVLYAGRIKYISTIRNRSQNYQ